MNPTVIALIVFACTFGAALVGMALRVWLPDDHLDARSTDVAKLLMGLIGTMSALVLGLLIASAQSTYTTQNNSVLTLASDAILIDQALALYGPEAAETRSQLREIVETVHEQIWSPRGVDTHNLGATDLRGSNLKFFLTLQGLNPKTGVQSFAKSQALQLGEAASQTRTLMSQQVANAIPWPFLAIVVVWISLLFMGFGLLARYHLTILIVMFTGALSVAAAIFLILELGSPYSGLIQLSDAPVRGALAQIGRSAP